MGPKGRSPKGSGKRTTETSKGENSKRTTFVAKKTTKDCDSGDEYLSSSKDSATGGARRSKE